MERNQCLLKVSHHNEATEWPRGGPAVTSARGASSSGRPTNEWLDMDHIFIGALLFYLDLLQRKDTLLLEFGTDRALTQALVR